MTSVAKILLGVSGSIAAYKAVDVARRLVKTGRSVQVAMTHGATQFVTPLTFEAITQQEVLTDVFRVATGRGVEIGHVEQAHAVDLVVIAPASANLIARMAMGLADDLLTATLLSTPAPIYIAPAMESGMWSHPATQDNLTKLRTRGVFVLGPASGELASGRQGIGRMLEPEQIMEQLPLQKFDLEGVVFVITAGPTWEPLDPVRVLTNRSTGAMGIAIADAAIQRGAKVHLILGPTHLRPTLHSRLQLHEVETAEQMLATGRTLIEKTDVLVATAAVSDFRPARSHAQKLKRSAPEAHALELTENPDVLATLASELRGCRTGSTVVGFAAETENVEANARSKLEKKGCDLVMGNIVGPKRGFGAEKTQLVAVFKDGEVVTHQPASKTQHAERIVDDVLRIRRQRSANESETR